MSHFEILVTETGADQAGQTEEGDQLMWRWIKVSVKIRRGIDWEKDGPKLLAKLRKASELNEE